MKQDEIELDIQETQWKTVWTFNCKLRVYIIYVSHDIFGEVKVICTGRSKIRDRVIRKSRRQLVDDWMKDNKIKLSQYVVAESLSQPIPFMKQYDKN